MYSFKKKIPRFIQYAIQTGYRIVPGPHRPRYLTFSGHYYPLNIRGEMGLSPSETEFLHLMVRMIRPELVLETGSRFGFSTSILGHALMKNRSGHCHTIEMDPSEVQLARTNFRALHLSRRITCHQGHSVDVIKKLISDSTINKNLDLVFLDSGLDATIDEFELVLNHIRSGSGLMLCHDVFLPRDSGKGVLLYPYLKDRYSDACDISVINSGAAGFVLARKRGDTGCDAYPPFDPDEIKTGRDYFEKYLPLIEKSKKE